MIRCDFFGNGGAAFETIFNALAPEYEISKNSEWYSRWLDLAAKAEGGRGGPHIVKRFDPDRMQEIFGVEMQAPDFLMFLSQPF